MVIALAQELSNSTPQPYQETAIRKHCNDSSRLKGSGGTERRGVAVIPNNGNSEKNG